MSSSPTDSVLQVLQLLADGATSEQIAAVEAPPHVRALALAAAQRLEHQRRRERELRALVDTARELAATDDPDQVLDAIVQRARTLLGTDVAYLTLHDPQRGDTFMRATAGTVATSFGSLRLALGKGLGGLVAATQQPWWSADYPLDDRFDHTDAIDSGVADEGIVAICGTPLLVGGDFVGVLFAANRFRHHFTPEQVALLGSLAALAAVSLVQARARSQTQEALAALSVALDEVQRHTEDVERTAQAHDRLLELIVAGGGVEGITRALGEVLGGWVVLVDADGQRRGAYGPVPCPSADDPDDASELDRLGIRALVEAADRSGRAAVDGDRYAVIVRARHAGRAVLTGAGVATGSIGEADQRIVERASVVTALVLLFEHDTRLARQRAVSDLVSDVVAGQLDHTEALRQLRREGLDPSRSFCLVVLRPTDRPIGSLVLAAGTVAGPGSLVGEHRSLAVALVAGGDPGQAARRLVDLVRGFGEVTAAAVGPLTGLRGIPAGFAEARRTVEAMRALGRRGQTATAGDLGFAGLVVGSDPDVADYVRRVLGPLLDYDAAHDTELLSTLEAWFANGRSAHRAADPLHVHVNTVSQRLARIAALLGPSWTEAEPALELQLALRMRRLLTAPGV